MTNVIPMTDDNFAAAVTDYAVRIKNQMNASTTAWKEIARLFAAAEQEFTLQSDAMKQLLKQTKFSMSKAAMVFDCNLTCCFCWQSGP